MVTECGTDVLVSFTESLHIYTGLLSVATVCGGLSGILAAVLLYVYCLKHLLLTRQVSKSPKGSFETRRIPAPGVFIPISSSQGYNARRLLDPDDGAVDNHNRGVRVSDSRKEAPNGNDEKVFILRLLDRRECLHCVKHIQC